MDNNNWESLKETIKEIKRKRAKYSIKMEGFSIDYDLVDKACDEAEYQTNAEKEAFVYGWFCAIWSLATVLVSQQQ